MERPASEGGPYREEARILVSWLFCALRLLPAAAESAVELDQALELGAARLREREFGGEKRALAIENFEISCGPTFVAHIG